MLKLVSIPANVCAGVASGDTWAVAGGTGPHGTLPFHQCVLDSPPHRIHPMRCPDRYPATTKLSVHTCLLTPAGPGITVAR